jgi:hypothetical protein
MNLFNKSSEVLIEELNVEQTIRLLLPDVNIYFDYQELESETELNLVTISKTHGERFLFHKIKSNSKLNCLKSMLDYIQSDYQTNYQNYEIQWAKKGELKTYISWFYAKSFIECIDKFFHLKDTQEIIVYSVTLRPQS